MSRAFHISHEFSISMMPHEVYKSNLNAIKQVSVWHDLNECLNFSWRQYNVCFLQHVKVSNFLRWTILLHLQSSDVVGDPVDKWYQYSTSSSHHWGSQCIWKYSLKATIKACNSHSHWCTHTPSSYFSAKEAHGTHLTYWNKRGISDTVWSPLLQVIAPWTATGTRNGTNYSADKSGATSCLTVNKCKWYTLSQQNVQIQTSGTEQPRTLG